MDSDEQERVQKKTFVNWINSHLSKRIPPLRIDDLIYDLRDGTKLLALLEVLSGEKLPMERGRVLRRPHFLSNANTALRFLAGKRIKLVNINAADLVDGRPAVVLGLIWTIILYFQIEENSRALEYLGGSRCASVMSQESGAATPTHRAEDRWKQGAKKTLLQWVANALPKDSNIQVADFGPSWRDGVAFLAIIDAIKANLINLAEMKRKTNRQRLEHAFDVAETELGIARLLDAEDVDVDKPDERSIMTYVAQFLHKYPEPKTTGPDAVAAVQEEYESLRMWLTERVTVIQRQYDTRTLSRNYEDYVRAENERLAREPTYQKLEKLMYTQSLVAIAPKSWRELVSLWIELERLHRRWLWLLDSDLPGDFRAVGEWLSRAEYLLYFDEIPNSLDERTAALISEKLEEHTSFFAALPEVAERFEAALRSPDAARIPTERLQEMKERLEAVSRRAPQRKARLKYLEHKCCIVAFTELTKAKLATWTAKCGRVEHVRALLDDYDNFVTKNKIFQEFDKAYVDIKQVAEEYKRVCEVDRTEAREIDSFLREISETWRRVASDVRCARSVLEEVIAHWERWTMLVEQFTAWLDKAQHMLRVSEDEGLEFFHDLTVWKEKHQILGDAAGFLAATCSEDISSEIKRKYVEITERWERVWEEAERYVRGGDALRHRRELAAGIQTLDNWLSAAENLLSRQPRANTTDIQTYIDQLLQLNSEIEHHEEVFKTISRTFQNAIADLPRDEVESNMGKLKQQKEALVRVRATVPVKLHQYRQLLVQHESLESGQKEIGQWLDRADELLRTTTETRREVIEERYEIHRTFFSRTTYYRSMLESKNKVFQNIVKAADVDRSADVTDQVRLMKDLNDRFAHVSSEATRKESELQRLVRAWDEFESKKRTVEEWASRAEALLADNRVDSKQVVDFHKRFFQGADERAVSELVRSGRELIELVNAEDRPRIVQTVEELQRRWKELLDRAPPHLMRLEFRLDEAVFHHCIKDIEKELVYEEQAYNQSDDADGILIRNEEYFRNQGKIMQVEHCLQNLKKISTSYTHQTGDSTLDEAVRKCEQQWESTVHRVEHFRQQLQRIPAKWDAYREKFREMEKWMDHVDKTMDSIVREVDSAEAFEREKTIFQNICREADKKREDMKWLVQTLDMLTHHCSDMEAQDEQIKLENLIQRYKNLIPTIEITMIKTETYTRCYTYRREVHEVICILESAKQQAMVEPEPQSLQHVEQLVLEQQAAVQKLDRHRPSVMSMLQRGKELIKDANAPAFVREDVRNLETGWNTAYETSTDRLYKLRDTQKVWSNYEYQKEELLSDIDKIESYIAHPGLELGVTNIGRELHETRVINEDLEKAKKERLPQLQQAYAELQSLTANKPKPVIEKDLQTIGHKLEKVQDEVHTKVEHLEKFNEEWIKVERKLEHVREWIKKESPALISQIRSENITPEERVEKSQDLQKVITEKLEIIKNVADQGTKLAVEHRVHDANRLKGEVALLEKMMADLQRSTEHQTKVVEHDLASWQKYQKGVAEIKPWIEEAEIKLGNVPKPTTLPEAQQLQQQSRALITDSEKQLMNLQILSSVSHQLSGKTSAPDEVDAIHSRWAVVHDQADQWNNKLEKLVVNWENFEREAEKLETWVENGEKLLSSRNITVESPQIEKLDRELNKLKSFGNEISQQQAKIISLSQTCDNICHSIQPEGAALLKNKVADIKDRTNSLAETVRTKINELSDKIIVRQEFLTKLHNFDNWITDFRRKTESFDQISADKVEPSLQSMHVLLQEHAAKAPEFADIYNEVKNMTLTSHPDESRTLSDTYSNIAEHYQLIESNIQQNKAILKKWSDLLSWYEDTKQQLGHIQYQIDGPKLTPESYEVLRQELVNVITKVPEWKSNVVLLDGPSKVKVADQNTGRIISPTSLVKEIEVKAETLLNQVTSKRDLVQKVGARWDKFNLQQKAVSEVLHNVQSTLNEMAQKPLPLTEIAIQDLSEQLDRLDQELKDKQAVRKELREEGLHLMREDQANMGTIQNSLSAADHNWDQVVNSVRDTKNRYILLSSTLQELKNFTGAFDREMSRAQQLHSECKEAPNDYVQTAQSLDKARKSYEILKRSKGLLDQMDVIKQSILKQASTLGGFDTSPLENSFLDSQTQWEKENDAIIKRIQDLESQLLVWRQIDDTKNQVVTWLSETGQNLSSACDNLEIRFGQNHLTKYKEELPIYTGLKNSIKAKCEQITNLNKNIPTGQVSSIIDYLDKEFEALQILAENLESAVSSLESKENKLKENIKRLSDSVSKVRDDIIKCDDMSGDNAKILDRLKKCQACKVELQNLNDEIDNLSQNVSEMNANYPGFYESLVPKELSTLQKRFESVLVHANKTEITLLTFLQKLFTDKLSMFNRNLKILDDKTRWCVPDASSDKYNLEVKTAALSDVENGIADCNQKVKELKEACEILRVVAEPASAQEAAVQTEKAQKNLDVLTSNYDEIKNRLQENIEAWQEYETLLENVSEWLKQKENQVRQEAASLVDMNAIEDKIIEIEKLNSDVKNYGDQVNKLTEIGDKILSRNPESRVLQYINHLVSRYQTVSKFMDNHLNRLKDLNDNKGKYDKSIVEFKNWLEGANGKIAELAAMSKHAKPSAADLAQVKKLSENKDLGQKLLNNAIESGEALFSGINPEGREQVRNELRALRDSFEDSVDSLNNVIKDIETTINKRSSFDDTFNQVQKWISDKDQEFGEFKLCSTLPEKKAHLHANKILLQEVELHASMLSQLSEKIKLMPDEEAEKSLSKTIERYTGMSKELEKRIATYESHVSDHEKYVQMFEDTRDRLNHIVSENSMLTYSVVTQKDDVNSKISAIEKEKQNKAKDLYETRNKKTPAFEEFLSLGEKLYAHTSPDGREALCSTLQEKEAQLKRYVDLRNAIHAKEKDIDAFVDESHSLIQISGVERLKPLVTQISSRYQQLHVISKEIVNHWSEVVADHRKYIQLNNEFDAWLKPLEEQLAQMITKEDKLNIESKGNKLQVFLMERDNGEHKIGILTTAGDKVLPETAANGRETIRAEIRILRERWDKLNDSILQQQKEYESQTLQWSSYQEVLQQTLSWLDEKEKLVDSEEKSVLNSAQEIKSKVLKNKTLLQEIYSHKRVIETVTEKAKSVASTLHTGKEQSDEMTTIIQSVWDRYNALTSRLSSIIDKHENTYEIYQNFADQQKSLQDYQKHLWDRLHLLSDFTGNKAALQSKLTKIQELLDAIPNGNNKLKILSDLIDNNSAKLSPRGKDGMSRELSLLRADLEKFTTTVHDVKRGIEDKIQQWIEFDSANDRLQHWLTDTEMSLKTFTPKATLDEKVDQLNKYQAILANLKKTENDVDKLTDEFSDLIENCNDTRITMNLQQMTSRFQSVHSTAKELVKKCQQAVNDHTAYQEKYNQCTDWLKTAQHKFDECQKNLSNTPEGINAKRESLKELLSQQRNAALLVNNTVELGEKLYPSTSPEGKELIEQQLQDIQQAIDNLYESITKAERDLDSELSKWSSFEDNLKTVQEWLTIAEKNLPKEIELKATLDEKRNQLNVYRNYLQDAISHQQDLSDLESRAQNLPDITKNVIKEINQLKQRHDAILARAKSFVEQYEAIVNNHQQYTKAVMDLQEWVEATHNTAQLWGDINLERVALSSNCEKLKSLQVNLPEEKNRIDKIRSLGEKVLPGTVSSGQANIRNQIDASHQEWEGLISFINKTIEGLENKIQQWNEYENMKDQCLAWIRNTDNQIHAVDLKATLAEKQDQYSKFQELQGEVRAKELEIDNITEKAQHLYTGMLGPRGSQISDLTVKYQTLSQKVKDLTNRWQQYVKTHQEFTTNVAECSQWIEELRDKLDFCSDLSSCSQDDLETKLVLIQNLLLSKDEGFTKVQSLVELAQNVMANTAPAGHEAINNSLINLQEQWSALLSRMIETKNMLDDSVTKWAGFLEQIQFVDKSNAWLENMLSELTPFESSMTDKRAQLEKLKEVEEKARCDRLDVDTLKAKAAEMIASGQQNQAATRAQEALNKFDSLYDKIKKLLSDREEQYKDHRLYKEAHDELIQWLSRAREKVPSLKSKPLSDKLAIENAVAPLDALINKQAQGELLLEHLQHTGEVVLASTSPEGQTTIKNEMKALKESFDDLFNEIKQQKSQLEKTVSQWREYKDEYERLSDWLQQKEILIKNQKLALLGTAKEKGAQVNEVKEIVDQLNKGKAEIDKFNASASDLLSSHLDTYVNNQLRHLNSRYQVLVNMANDVLKKVETNYEQHQNYDDNYVKTKKWIDDAWEITRSGSEAGSNSSKEALQKRLEQIEDLLKRREEGQNLVHATVNSGEKVLRNTRSDGKDKINTELKELQNEWDRLVKKMTTAKVHLETALLQWADYSSSYSQLQQWISDREAKLQEVCEQKVAKSKKGQDRLPGLTTGLSLGERKATLRQTNNIVQDIVSFEPMIQSVTSKASELMQQAPASEITSKYETLSKQAKDLYEKQKETVEQHQAFIDAGTDFVQWIRAARERLGKCSDATGDKESLSSKISQLKVLESELPEGQKKLQKALELGEISCSLADDDDKEEIEEEVALLQEEFDTYVEQLNSTKALIEGGIVKWTEYEEQYKEALDWLSKTEKLVQSFNKLQNNLEQKKVVLEEFQGHLQTLFDWQTELDKLNMRAQTLLETCADTRISNGITQLTTKYNALLSLAKEVMKRLELHYQEHQQHNALYGECQDWLDRTREKLNQCADIPNNLQEVNTKLNTVKLLRQSLEQGQNKLRYLLELKEKVIMNTEQAGAAKIQEDTDNLKQEFDKLIADLQDVRNKLTSRASQFDDISKIHKLLVEWLNDIDQKIQSDDSLLNDLSEKKAKLEKFRTFNRDIDSHKDLVNKLNEKLQDDASLKSKDIDETLKRYGDIRKTVNDMIGKLEDYVNSHIQYKESYDSFYDWIRNCKIEIQQCSDSHGEKKEVQKKLKNVNKIIESLPKGEALLKKAIQLSEAVMETTGNEGKDNINQEIKQLKIEWENLQHICKDTKKLLEKCLAAWSDFLETSEKMSKWVKDFDGKLATVQKVDKITPEYLDKCRDLLAQALANKHVLEELNDRCENLMELSACAWVRDKTVNLQTEYTSLLTKIQSLVSNGEKNLSDHTEFIKAKEELQQWLETAHGTVQDSIGVGDIETTKDKLETVKLVNNRMTEGHHLLVVLQEAFKKALNNTPPEEQDGLRNDVQVLQESWDQLKIDLNSITAQLKAAIGKWEDFEESKNKLNQWIDETEKNLDKVPPTGGELGEMKTLLEKYKHIEDEIDNKKPELDRLKGEAAELSGWARKPAVKQSVAEIEKRCNALKAKCAAKKAELEGEIKDYNQYHQSLQDTEKWLLQVSFQLMAHNSLYIANREQTEEQLAQHALLLDDVQKYRATLDELEAKGRAQVDRYEAATPAIRDTVARQLKNVNDSHKSLLATALQIERRLREGLAKFKEYEDTLESILNNLDECEPAITELDVPVDGLAHGRDLLDKARALHNRLQGEKARLSAAVAACSAAAASVSRPASPADSAPLPVPPRELHARARLEDLIDQKRIGEVSGAPRVDVLLKSLEAPEFSEKMVSFESKVQSHLETLGDAVHGMEEAMKQVLEIQEWINVHKALAHDWLSNPSKLRPEAAKNDMAAMNDALASLAEKRNRLLTEIPTEGLEDEINLEEELDSLEKTILRAIEREKSNQGIIDDFRHKCQEIHDWFDSVLKKMCLADKGSGLPCPQKLSALKELSSEFGQAGKDKVDNIKTVGSQVINIVSNLESQQVEEQMKSVERRYNDIAKRIQRKLQMLEITYKAIDGTKSEVNAQNEWLQKEIDNIHHPEPLGYESKAVKDRQKKIANLLKETDGKKTVIDSLEKKVSNIQAELEPSEQMQLESELSELASKQKQLASLIKQEIERLSGCAEVRKKLENDIEKAKNWLKSKLAEIKKLGGPVPLEVAKVEKEIAVHKKHQSELADFHNDTLSEVIRQGNAVTKDCSAEDRAKLQGVLEGLNKSYTSAKVDIDDKLAALNKLLQGRNEFENDVAKCQSWLNEAEVAATPELRTTSLQLLEEQLAKFEKLSKEAEDVEKNITKIKDKSKDIMDTLSDSNKLQLKEQVNVLSDKFARINAIINDKKNILIKHIKEYKDAAAKIAAALEFLNEIQNKLKALNKPIGSKVEDVQPIIQAYESILADLKKNKSMLNELQGGNLHDLQDILTQQDDLMSTIEDQISKLKQLLLLREQFFALVKEIEEFVAKYTDVTAEIERSSDSLEDKIKRYDDIIVKIQGCEALLATATDKGQQIAAEGTVIDRNNITELLQSLKQQLLTLRRTVESKRQEHERAAAEHKKLAADLSEILQWLHDNETAVHSRPLLNRDVASVDKTLVEHATLAKNVQSYLDKFTKISDVIKGDDGVPGSLLEMVSEGNSLKTSLPAELANREKHLKDNKKYRQQYIQMVEKLNIWVNEAGIRLDMGKNGTDFENIESDLEEHKSFFNASEPEMKDLVGKKMQDVVDKIWPSLTASEQEELSKDHQKHNQLLKNTLNSAKSRQAQLEQDLEIWKDFCQLVEKIKALLDKNDIKDEAVTTVDALRMHLEKLNHAKNDLENQQPLLDVVRERAREICSGADAASGERVEQKTRELADRWNVACEDLAKRATTADSQLQRWTQLLDNQRSLAAAVTAASDRLRQLDASPSTRRRAIDTRHALQELHTDVFGLEESRDDLLEHADFVVSILKSHSKEAAEDTEKSVRETVEAYEKHTLASSSLLLQLGIAQLQPYGICNKVHYLKPSVVYYSYILTEGPYTGVCAIVSRYASRLGRGGGRMRGAQLTGHGPHCVPAYRLRAHYASVQSTPPLVANAMCIGTVNVSAASMAAQRAAGPAHTVALLAAAALVFTSPTCAAPAGYGRRSAHALCSPLGRCAIRELSDREPHNRICHVAARDTRLGSGRARRGGGFIERRAGDASGAPLAAGDRTRGATLRVTPPPPRHAARGLFSLRQTLAARLAEIDDIVSEFDRVAENIEKLRQLIEVFIAKVGTFYVFGEDDEGGVRELTAEVSELVGRTKAFTEESRRRYGGSAPADVAQELSALELSAEALAAAMEEKEREWKRARTARGEYATDVESVQAWLRAAELTARDRTLPPEPYRERLVATRSEVPSVADRLERLTRNARAIVEGSRDAGERQLVQSTVLALTDRFAAVCGELEARQAAVEDACDAVARFLALLEKVLLWVETQRAFLARPLPLADLQEAQQKQTEYGNALKSCKQQAKNLADMAKEIEAIERVTSPGDLPSRLEAAENATVDVEKKLAKTNGLLQELAEEWERCEKKLKDVGHWLEATTRTIEAPQNAKKPLRDRLALREKLINDISTQKTKISYSVEKLNVHFGPDGVASQSRAPEGVQRAAAELCAALDALGEQTGAQARQLSAALQQLDAYCAELARLRSQLLDAEQQLRHAAQPNYSPREPERAQRQQQECRERIKSLQSKIQARNERIKLLIQRGGPDADPLRDT
ncbi:unnamed protein product, partial [Iphiclides podalirius]